MIEIRYDDSSLMENVHNSLAYRLTGSQYDTRSHEYVQIAFYSEISDNVGFDCCNQSERCLIRLTSSKVLESGMLEIWHITSKVLELWTNAFISSFPVNGRRCIISQVFALATTPWCWKCRITACECVACFVSICANFDWPLWLNCPLICLKAYKSTRVLELSM